VADSILRVIEKETVDSSRMSMLHQLAFAYVYIKPDTAQLLSQQLIDFGKKSGIYVHELRGLAVSSSIYTNLGNYARALQDLLEAIRICEKNKSDRRLQYFLINISAAYSEMGDLKESMRSLYRLLELLEKENDDFNRTSAWINLGNNYEKLNRLDSARIFTTMANELARKINDEYGIMLSYTNLGNIHAKSGETDIAMSYYRYALDVGMKIEEYFGLAEATLGMAKLFERKGRHDSALHYARQSANIARQNGFMQSLHSAGSYLADFYEKHNRSDSAYAYLRLAAAAKDSIFSTEKTNHLQSLMIEEKSRQLKLEEERLQTKLEREKNIQYGIIAITLLTFTILFMVLSRSVVVNEKWIHFMGILGLLLVFEFVNLMVHPLLADITHHSPIWMLAIMVVIAAILIPLHHRLEHFIKHRLIAKNRQLRLQAAKRLVAQLEQQQNVPTQAE